MDIRQDRMADWGQGNPSHPDYIKGRTHYDDSVVIGVVSDDFDGSENFTSDFVVEFGQTIKVSNDNVTASGVIEYAEPGSVNNLKALLRDENEVLKGQINFDGKVLTSLSGDNSLAGATIEYLEFKQLDEKFIPDTIARDGDVVHIEGEETVTGVKNFSNGLQVGGQSIVWDSTNQCLKVVFN